MMPEGWEEGRLLHLISGLDAGVSVNSEDRVAEKGEKAILKTSCVSGGYFNPKQHKAIVDEVEVSRVREPVEVDRIILSRMNTPALVGASAYISRSYPDLFLPDRLWQLKPKNKNVSMKWVTYFLASPHTRFMISNMATGTSGTMKNITKKDVLSLKVLMPPYLEQKKIAQILSIWDKAIEIVEALIEKSTMQKKGLMQKLLKGKCRFNEFANNKWIETKIRNIAEINPTKPKKPKDGNVSFVPMGSVSIDGKIITSEIRNYDDVAKGFTSFVDNDVLIAKITPCFENGKGGYVTSLHNGVGFGSTEFHVLRAKKNIDSKFVSYITRTHEFMFRGETNMQGSAGQRRVPTDFIRNYKVKIPCAFEEQKKISDVLTTLDLELDNQNEQKRLLKEQKKALMQQLLTGKRRVRLDEENKTEPLLESAG